MRKNVASQIIAAQLINKTTGASVTTGSCTVYVTINGGTQASGGGTVTHEGNGEWSYAPTQAETNGNHVAFTWTHTDAVAVTINVYPVSYDPTDSAGLGLSRIDVALSTLATAAALTTVDDFLDTEIAAIKAKTDNLPSDPADASDIASSFSTVNSTLSTIAAYLDTEIAAILADTNELQTDWTDSGRLDLLIDAIKAKTDNLPSDPADQSAVESAITAATSPLATAAALTTVDDFLDTEIAAIKAKTDNLPADPADASDIASSFSTVNSTLSTIAAYLDTEIAAILADTNELQTDWTNGGRLDLILDSLVAGILTATGIADAVLARGVSNVEATANTTSLATVILALLESSISGSTWTIRKTDGTTFVQKTLTTDPYAEPIASVT